MLFRSAGALQISLTSTTATLVDFDTIRGDTGHGVSLVSGGNGRIRLSGGNHYHIVGSAPMDKDTAGAVLTKAPAVALDTKTVSPALNVEVLKSLRLPKVMT